MYKTNLRCVKSIHVSGQSEIVVRYITTLIATTTQPRIINYISPQEGFFDVCCSQCAPVCSANDFYDVRRFWMLRVTWQVEDFCGGLKFRVATKNIRLMNFESSGSF